MLVWISIGFVLLLLYMLFRRSIRHLVIADTMFPSPASLPIIGSALLLLYHRRDMREYGGELLWWYRRSFCAWILNQLNVVVYTPEEVEKVLGNSTNLEKADHYNLLLPWIGRGLLTSFGNKWKKHRKILTPAFHFNILETFLEIFNENGNLLCEKLDEFDGRGNFDVYQPIKHYALDNICEAAMGTKINAQINPDSDYVKSIKIMCEVVFTRSISPWYWPTFIFNLSDCGRRHNKALSIIHKLTRDVITKRQEEMKNENLNGIFEEKEGKKRKVFLDILLQSEEEGGLKFEEIVEEVDTFMFEGHDTVTSALSFALHALAENPHCQEKAYQEQLAIFGDEQRPATLRDLNAMKYMDLIVKETLRLYPSVPIIGRKVTEEIVLDEKATIPKGSQVLIFTELLHNFRAAWEKPTEFYPEHFEPEVAAKRHPFQYIPFSAGPRNCIGMRFATLEMKSTLSKIIRRYHLMPSNPAVPLKLTVDLILISETGVNIQLRKRIAS